MSSARGDRKKCAKILYKIPSKKKAAKNSGFPALENRNVEYPRANFSDKKVVVIELAKRNETEKRTSYRPRNPTGLIVVH